MSFDAAPGLGLSKWVESRINGGMITSTDAADIPDGALQLAKNARVRFDKTLSRNGHTLLSPVKPDNLPVLRIATLVDNQGNSFTYRFTPTGVWRRDGGGWTALTGTALAGGTYDKIKTVVINNQFVFANNGVGFIQLIDSNLNTYARLGNAPKYKYITGFYNRVIGANRTDGGAYNVELGWSGDTNIGEWDNSVDLSAGNSPLIESPDDFGDPISGVFGIANVLVIPREHSLWIGSKNPVADNPLNFFNAVPKIGTNCPWSCAPYERGLIWFDQRTGTVWLYEVGGGIDSIGRPIDNAIIKNIDDPAQIFGTYNPIENEYIVCIPSVGTNLRKCWTFNFRTKAWTYDELYNVVSADDVDIASGGISIDDLIGTIDSLVGTIDSLSPSQNIRPTRAYGTIDGEVLVEDSNTYDDNGVQYESEFISKLFEVPERDTIIAEVRIEYVVESECQGTLYLQKNGGDWVAVKGPLTLNQLNKTNLFRYVKQVRCRQLAWKFVTSGGKFNLIKYEIQTYVTGKSRR